MTVDNQALTGRERALFPETGNIEGCKDTGGWTLRKGAGTV